jgi:hypothetical protein
MILNRLERRQLVAYKASHFELLAAAPGEECLNLQLMERPDRGDPAVTKPITSKTNTCYQPTTTDERCRRAWFDDDGAYLLYRARPTKVNGIDMRGRFYGYP